VSWRNTQGTTNKTVVIARVEPALSPYHFYAGVGTSIGVLLLFPISLQISGLIWRHGAHSSLKFPLDIFSDRGFAFRLGIINLVAPLPQ